MWVENRRTVGLIKPFDRVELPALTIITGLNGAGKSQLLRGIASGQISTPTGNQDAPVDPPSPPHDVVSLTNTDADPDGLIATRLTNLDTILKSPVRAVDAAEVVKQALREQYDAKEEIEQRIATSTGKTLEEHNISWGQLVFEVNQSRATQLVSMDAEEYATIAALARNAGLRIQQTIQDYQKSAPPGAMHPPIVAMPSHLLTWSRDQFAGALGWGEASLFAPDLTNTFLEYRNRLWRDQVQRHTDSDAGTSVALGKEGFEKVYGAPPWERVTEALQAFGLPYSVAAPSTDPAQGVAFRLMRDGANKPLEYNDLSSGERVLIRMVLASFQANDERLNVRHPKLILLDELDASLHPENVRRWLEAIQTGYVDAMGISCILTTHSPTTVALAPEGSIFEMNADDPRPIPITKQHAIDRLTAGLPMLAIDYSARRQVFTESTIDVAHYSMVHDIMRPKLDMERTLSFVGTSTKGSCNFVYDMVKHMEKNGNRSVFGIVDWDLKNEPTQRVKVLADGTHYSKENVLLDPLLVGALLLKDDDIQLDPPVRYTDLRDAPVDLLQRVSDAVTKKVKFPLAATNQLARNTYSGGLELEVRQAYQTMQGHGLEKAIKEAFPMLGGRCRSEGELISEIITRVIGDFPEFCPKSVTDLLLLLANDEP